MTLRQHFQCRSCRKIVALRIQLGYRDQEKIAFSCPECKLPISAVLKLDQVNGQIIGFESILGATLADADESDFIVNHSPDFAQTAGTQGSEIVSGFVEAFRRGGGTEEFLFRVRRQQLLQQIVVAHNHEIEQIVRLYELEKWDHFTRLAAKYLADDETMEDPITRESALIRAMEQYIGPLILSVSHSRTLENAWQWIDRIQLQHPEAFAAFMTFISTDAYLDRAWREGLDLYLRFFSSIDSFRQVLAEWDPELPDNVELPELIVTGALDFDKLKALYVDGYEFLARFLTFTSGLENIEARGSYDAYLAHPTITKFRPRSLADFHGKANAPKLAYAHGEFAKNVAAAMEPALRNGLGHYSARLDRDAGMIAYLARADGGEMLFMSYASFLMRLVRLAMRVQETIYFIKFLRTYAAVTSKKP